MLQINEGGSPLAYEQPALFLQAPPGEMSDDQLTAAAYIFGDWSLDRLERGEGCDLPVGAVAYDPSTGLIAGGFACDQECDAGTDDNQGHAERQALDTIVALGANPNRVVVATMLEPCLRCLRDLAMHDVERVVYAVPRSFIEHEVPLVNPRQSAPDRAATGDARFPELSNSVHPALRLACESLFRQVQRNRVTKEVSPQIDRTLYRPGVETLVQLVGKKMAKLLPLLLANAKVIQPKVTVNA